MPDDVVVRPFRRTDRDQVTELVNAHVRAVVPNVSVSVSGLLSQLEREPGEYIVDRWVTERLTLVAEQRERVVAAAHLLRYADDDRVSAGYRGAGEIRWLVAWPDTPNWPDAIAAGRLLTAACVARLARWEVRTCHADGALPAPGVYGVPEQWPHVRALYRDAGFSAPAPDEPDAAGVVGGSVETVWLARVDDLPRPAAAPLPGLTERRSLGACGTRLEAVLDGVRVGYVEVEARDEAPRTQGTRTWADVGNLHVSPDHRRLGVGTWLLGRAADWLDLGGVTRLLSYTSGDEHSPEAVFHAARGFRILTRTIRGWTLTVAP